MTLSTSSSKPSAPEAWQPLTFGGVAAFARAPLARLLLVAVVVAGLVSLTAFRFISDVWGTTVSAAIARLPTQGAIENGRLVWPHGQPITIADNAFVAISVTPGPVANPGQTADLLFEFKPTTLAISSLLGYVELNYPPDYVFALNRTELEPLWGAWRPHLLAGAAAACFLGTLGMWAALATVIAIPLRAYAVLTDRQMTLGGGWRLAVAALLPGALLMGLAILGYAVRRLTLGELLLAHGLHWLVGTAYLLISPLYLPPTASGAPFGHAEAPPLSGDNPFAGAADSDQESPEQAVTPPRENPFEPSRGGIPKAPPPQPPTQPPPPEPDSPLNPS